MNLKYLLSFSLILIHFSKLYAQNGTIDFIQNKNQFPDQVHFKADIPGGAVFITEQGFTYSYYSLPDIEAIHEKMHEKQKVQNEPVHMHAFNVSFANANKHITFTEEGLQPYYNNYFIGNDKDKWASHVPLYKKVTWHNVYNNIDAVVYSKGASLKYDFVVKPNADIRQLSLSYKGVQPKIMPDGSLLIQTSVNSVSEQAPYAYQLVNGKETPVVCHFKKTENGNITFDFPDGYNQSVPLIIDPVLVFSTFSGSTVTTFGFSATYDLQGHLYAGGECFGVGWPYSTGAFQTTFGGNVDAGINKYSANGSTRIYATYYGGDRMDLPNNMMVNHHDELVICGSTLSSNLPVTTGCYDSTFANSANPSTDIYIARFSTDGSQLRAATYLGGSGPDGYNDYLLSPNYGDANRGEVFTAANGNIYITNSTGSTDFPVTANAYQSTNAGMQDAIVCELDSNLTTLIYSTYLGGSANDAAFSLLLTSTNQIAICGGTKSSNFPTTAGSYKTTAPGGTDAFVSILYPSTAGSGLLHSSFLGTAFYDHAFKIQKDDSDNIFVLGQTAQGSGYPISSGVYHITGGNIFIQKLNPTLSTAMLATTMGNFTNSDYVPTAFLHDVCGNTYMSGFSAAINSPLTTAPNASYQTTPGSFWLGVLSPDFTSLLYSTFLGGQNAHVDGGSSRFDPAGIIFHSACTSDPFFPTTSGVVSPAKLSPSWDIASFKFDMGVGAVEAAFELANNASDTGCADYHVAFNNLSTGASVYHWYFDNDTSSLVNPEYTFTEGLHTVTLVATRSTGCYLIDSATRNIFVKPMFKPQIHMSDTVACDSSNISISANVSNSNSLFEYHWEPVNAIVSNPNQEQVVVNPTLSNTFTVYINNTVAGACVDSAMRTIHLSINDYSTMYAVPADTTICPGDTITIKAFGGTTFLWTPNERIADVNAAETAIWPNKNMVYKVKIVNEHNCMINRDVIVKMMDHSRLSAGNDKDIKRGESVQLDGVSDGPFYWSPPGLVFPANNITPTVSPDQTTTYYLYASAIQGCLAMDSVTVHVTNAMLPNAFSPNGDGNNDVFKLNIQDERVHLKDFSVFNRYGQRVFYTKDITEGWNGNYNGVKCDLGTFYYLVHYIIGEKTFTLKGDVTLIR